MTIRSFDVALIEDAVARMCGPLACIMPTDVWSAMEGALDREDGQNARSVLKELLENYDVAAKESIPICQDTGMACVFVELGTDVHIEGDFEAAVNEGVRRGYGEGYLRKSIAADPLRRGNTGDNTPAAITVHLVNGEGCRVTVAP